MQAFFLPGLSFTETDDSQDNRSREGTIVFYFLLIPRAHERSDIYRFNVEYMWSVCRVQDCYSMIFDLLAMDANFFLMISPQTQDVN